MIDVEQIRAARAMLNLKQQELAKKAGISIGTLNNIERGVQTDPKISTMKAIQVALEREGINFIEEHDTGIIGLTLKKKPHAAAGPVTATILIVDDNKADRMLYKNWLGKASGRKYKVLEAKSAQEGIDTYVESKPDCVILDFVMYGADGFQMLAALKREQAKIPPIIFVTGMHTKDLEENAKSQGVHAYLRKQGLRKEDLCRAVDAALTL